MLSKNKNIFILFFLIFSLVFIMIYWMNNSSQRNSIVHTGNVETAPEFHAQERNVNTVAIVDIPDFIDPKAIEIIERFNERVSGITEEDLIRERNAIDELRRQQEEKAIHGERVEEESVTFTLLEGEKEFSVIKRVFPDGEVRYDFLNKYNPSNESAGWE